MADTHVLVVDDNPDTLNLVAHVLESEGFRVRTASSVLRAVEALHDGSPKPSVIVTDLIMPQTTGWDFLKHLRAEPAMKSMPIVVITGADAKDSEGLADAVLQKPFDPAHLVATVRLLLRASDATGF
jgi:CheY-like chemotaxis protein